MPKRSNEINATTDLGNAISMISIYIEELVPHCKPRRAWCHRAAAEVVAWPGRSLLYEHAAILLSAALALLSGKRTDFSKNRLAGKSNIPMS
jgi:hypothetical protein